MIRTLLDDLVELARASTKRAPSTRSVLETLMLDGFAVLATVRLRAAARRLRVPLVNRLLRLGMTAVYGVDIGNDVRLGRGVYFVHPIGTVIGGDASVGDRVRFLGNNTVGTARDDGYPVIDDDVVVGCGARILGRVHVGRGAVIGANAVVLEDVPPHALAAGVPATVRKRVGAAYAAAAATGRQARVS
jgi:serine O-acetyltransferase